MVGRIRLAWWRERLQELDETIVPAEPILAATARLIADTPLTGAMLAQLPDQWEALLEPFPWPGETIGAVAERGAMLFGFAAIIAALGRHESAKLAGALWSLLDVARHCSDPQSRFLLIDMARGRLRNFRGTVDASTRPLTMLGLLAKRDVERWPDVEPEATPGRAWAMIRHKLTGKL